MTKFFVKKPYYAFVVIIIVLVIGWVSLTQMTTDFLPDMELPYLIVITTDIGASPAEVETDVVEPLEEALGTVSGVKNVYSTSADNYGMVMLEFNDEVDMDSTMVRVSRAASTISLPENCGKPNIIEMSMDLMASMYTSVSFEGMDQKELTAFVRDTLVPTLKRQDGVASISLLGEVEDRVEIRLNGDKIDILNEKVLNKALKVLDDSQRQLDDARNQLDSSLSSMDSGGFDIGGMSSDLSQQIAETGSAQAERFGKIYEMRLLQAQLQSLLDDRGASDVEEVRDEYYRLNEYFWEVSQMDLNYPSSVEEALENPGMLNALLNDLEAQGSDTTGLDEYSLTQIMNILNIADRIDELSFELEQMGDVSLSTEALQEQIRQTAMNAVSGIGGQLMMAMGSGQIESASAQIESAQKQLDDARESIGRTANINQLVSMQTLASILKAQSFRMPAGYVEDEEGTQWLLEVGEEFSSPEQISGLVLANIEDIGEISINDVADVVLLDNAGQSYAKLNGHDSLLINVFKTSTAGTSEVTDRLLDKYAELEEEYPGLKMTTLVNQGAYIKQIIRSVLSSILLGAGLAILVLALFLKNVLPTIVVAFSIPFSVLLAIIVMYFTKVSINAMSLAGLCIGIGMLVDNSIVVMENIYRLCLRGLSAPRAAVQGTKQVMGSIVASTVTTICVFLPMVFTTGMVTQLLFPFAFTISYALMSSLIVALTVVPSIGSVMFKKIRETRHPFFDRITRGYGATMAFCLKYKAVPLLIVFGLLAWSLYMVTQMGLVLIDGMESDQISVTMSLPEEMPKEQAIETADLVSQRVLEIEGVEQVGIMTSGGSTMAAAVGMGTPTSEESFTRFTLMVLTDESVKTTQDFKRIRNEIQSRTADIEGAEVYASSSAMGSMSSLTGGSLEVNVYGEDQQELIRISEDVMNMMRSIDGVTEVSNGISEEDRVARLTIDRTAAANHGLTVAQIYMQIASKASTEASAISIRMDGRDVSVKIIDETEGLNYENLMDSEIEASETDSDGKSVKNYYKLSDFASKDDGYTFNTISRENQSRYITVNADVDEEHNTSLLARELEKMLDDYKAPKGYMVEMSGSSITVNDMIWQMLKATALGAMLVYLVMVAQFQSLMSPFIIIFTVPLAFTGGIFGLKLFNQNISAMAMLGFMILMGTVVNNGIVFVDYANQLRIKGVEKHKALIATGQTRLRPILMTALTTILSMSVIMLSNDAGNAMQKGMAIVVCTGLIYATFTTLYIVPIMYDILYKGSPKEIDVGSDLDEVPDEVSDLLEQGE